MFIAMKTPRHRYYGNPKALAWLFFSLFIFFLPLYEAPKNIFSVIFIFFGVASIVTQISALKYFKNADVVCLAFALLVLSPFFAGIGSTVMDVSDRFWSALNWALMPLVALVLLMVNFTALQLIWSLRIFCIGTIVAIIESFSSWSGWLGSYPELNSVGHVNQSALYLAFSIIPVGLLLGIRRNLVNMILGVVVVAAVFWYQGPAKSLVGFAAFVMALGGVWSIYCWTHRYIKTLIGSLALSLAALLVALTIPPTYLGYYEHFRSDLQHRWDSEKNPYSYRDRILNSAVEVSGKSLLGFGLGSFGEATTLQRIKASVESRGGDWDIEKDRFFSTSHGHNIFANVLVERGWIGIMVLSLCLLAFLILFRRAAQSIGAQLGLLTLFLILFAGLGQSTLHVEHGQLAFICLALCFVIINEADSL